MDKYQETVFAFDTGYLKVAVKKEDGEYFVESLAPGFRGVSKFGDSLDAAMDEAMRLINDDGDTDDE